jgi:hypothetical protein
MIHVDSLGALLLAAFVLAVVGGYVAWKERKSDKAG